MLILYVIFLAGFILAITHAIFQPDCVIVAAGALAACYFASKKNQSYLTINRKSDFENAAPLFIALIFSILLANDHELLYAERDQALNGIQKLTFAGALLTLIGAVFWLLHPSSGKIPLIALICSTICFSLARILVPLASPEPFIDVFWINTSATHHFLSGQNPYSQNYPDIYQGYYGYKPGFTYWPFYLNAAAIFTALHCDIRYLGVLSDLMFAGVLVWVCKKGFVRALTTWGFVLIWLALPVSLFIIEQAWVDSLMLLTAVIAVIAYGSGWITISALFAGASIATKQYGFIVPAMITFAILGSQGWKKSVFFLSRILITVSILVFPFLIWDFESFYRNTIQILITIPMRTDSLTIPAFFSNIHNFEPPGQFLLILYVAAFSFGLHSCFRDPRPSAVLFTSAFCYGFIFLMGKQASANYYVVVVGLALMGLAQRTGEQNLACRT